MRGSIVRRLTLGPESRLRKKSDIERCQKRGAKVYTKHFLLLITFAPAGESRLAIAVTTKLEKRATVRNLIKRRIRHVFRVSRFDFLKPIDMVIVARRDVQSCEFADYQREILGALKAHGYIKTREEAL